MTSQRELVSAADAAQEGDLTTFGRRTGRPSRRTIWITTDPQGRIFVRSGQGLSRDWPKNLLADNRAVIHIDGNAFPVRARRVTDRDELRASAEAVKAKYGLTSAISGPGEPLTPAEQATFELVPADA